MKFSRLTATNKTERVGLITKRIYICDCGNEILIPTSRVTSGHTKSCGCLKIDFRRKAPGEAAKNEVLDNYTRGAKKRGFCFNLTETEFLRICSSKCYYCGIEPFCSRKSRRNNGSFIYNGIDRLDNNKGYTLENSVSCCYKCNIGKYTQTKEEFLEWIKKVYLHSVAQ